METVISTNTIISTNNQDTNTVPEGRIPLDYSESENALEIDRGIQDTIRGIRLSILAMGLGLAKIKAKKFYKDLGYKNISAYINNLADKNHLDRANIFTWLYMGEAYIKYQNELEEAGFTESDGPSKLPYLERALAMNTGQEVFSNLKTMTVREFASYAKGRSEADTPGEYRNRWVITEKGNSYYLNGKLAIIISSKINHRAAEYLKKLIHAASEALEHEGVILPVNLRNMREARRFEGAAEQLKKLIRRGTA